MKTPLVNKRGCRQRGERKRPPRPAGQDGRDVASCASLDGLPGIVVTIPPAEAAGSRFRSRRRGTRASAVAGFSQELQSERRREQGDNGGTNARGRGPRRCG